MFQDRLFRKPPPFISRQKLGTIESAISHELSELIVFKSPPGSIYKNQALGQNNYKLSCILTSNTYTCLLMPNICARVAGANGIFFMVFQITPFVDKLTRLPAYFLFLYSHLLNSFLLF